MAIALKYAEATWQTAYMLLLMVFFLKLSNIKNLILKTDILANYTTTKTTTTTTTRTTTTTSTKTTSLTTTSTTTTRSTTTTTTSTTTTFTTTRLITFAGNLNVSSAVSALTTLNLNSVESVQMITNLLASPYDMTACLTNCSSNGKCEFDAQNLKFYCSCFYDYYYGTTCDLDKRMCSTFQCFNNATCVNKINLTTNAYDFDCECPFPYYGRRCESRINLCLNSTCVANQGRCYINVTKPLCKCFPGYLGENCELLETSTKVVKAVSTGSAVVAILMLTSFFGLIIFMDVTKLVTFNFSQFRNLKVSPKGKISNKIDLIDNQNLADNQDLTEEQNLTEDQDLINNQNELNVEENSNELEVEDLDNKSETLIQKLELN